MKVAANWGRAPPPGARKNWPWHSSDRRPQRPYRRTAQTRREEKKDTERGVRWRRLRDHEPLNLRKSLSYCRKGAVVGVVTWEEGSVLYEHCHSLQDECDEELDVNEVPGTPQPPVESNQSSHNEPQLQWICVNIYHDISCFCNI